MTIQGAFRTATNIRGNQSATISDEGAVALVIANEALLGFTFVLKASMTRAQLVDMFEQAPRSASGTKTVTASGCAGWATLTTAEKAILTDKGYVLN